MPSVQKMQREGESGRRKLNQYTRYLTLVILIVQGYFYIENLKAQAGDAINPAISGLAFQLISTVILAGGSMFILWLGERITDRGIGNGVSIIIMLGIIARLPASFTQEVVTRLENAHAGGLVMFLIEMVILLAVMMAAILLVQGTRRVPVDYAKKIVGNRQYGGARQYIPLKPYAANVMPIIFAQAIMFIPLTLAGFSGKSNNSVVMLFMDHTSWLYNIVFALLIIGFTYLYTAITLNPVLLAYFIFLNNLKK